MSDYSSPIRRLASNRVKIEKYLNKIKESWKDPFSFMGIIAIVFFIILSVAPFLGFLPDISATSPRLPENFSFLPASLKIYSENPSQGHFLISANKFLIESPNFLLIEGKSLQAATPPVMVSAQVLGALIAGSDFEEEKKLINEHLVESGETLSSLAVKFNVSSDTIRWANNLKGSKLQIDQKLIIPSVSGVIHHVKSGDTIFEIARTYKAKTDEIKDFNGLSDENDIYIGDILVVPGGVMPSLPASPVIRQTPIGSTYFIPPTKGVISQGLHWHNAVDFANPCGALVFAAAQGVVQRVSYGWNGGYGNYLTILHPNGVVTLYAHFSEILVSRGSNVSQGTIIGRVGNTGQTKGLTGCHVHFEVRGGQNPFVGSRIGSRP